jgi:hypothetical protein
MDEVETRTYLLSQHVPFKFGEVLHSPHIISPTGAFLAADRLRV